jgi:ketosteroid isomerase-like protein
MSAQHNMATIRAWVDAINRNDVGAELGCWQPDGEYVVAPTGATFRGAAQLRHASHQSASAVAMQPTRGRKQITHLDAGEDWACVTYDSTATIEGPLVVDGATVIPAGSQRPISTKACVVFAMRPGKISRATEYFDI